nr:Ig-like domain-containing protein [uncultured Blautia sp.]
MKRKRLAFLLAMAMTVTSLDSSAIIASGADFSSEPVVYEENQEQAEEDIQQAAEEDEAVEISDADVTEDTFDTEDTSEEVEVQETTDEIDVQTAEASEEDVFDAGEENADISVQERDEEEATVLELEKSYSVNFKSESWNEEEWFSYVPEETGYYLMQATTENNDLRVRPMMDLYECKNGEALDYSKDMIKTDTSYGSLQILWKLKKGYTYYYMARNWQSELGEYSYQVSLQKAPSVESIALTSDKTQVIAGFDDATNLVYNSQIEMSYADGNKETKSKLWYGKTSDSYRYIFRPVLEKDGAEQDFGYGNRYFDEGTYTLRYVLDTSENGGDETEPEISSEPITIESVSVEKTDRFDGFLTPENCSSKYLQFAKIYGFVPSESGRWRFLFTENPIKTPEVKKRNDDGSYSIVQQTEAGTNTFELEAGATYYCDLGSSSGENLKNIVRLVDVDAVTVDMSNARTNFYANMDYIVAEGCQLLVKYEDDKTQTLTFAYDGKVHDTYGNEFSYKIDYGDYPDNAGSRRYDVGEYKLLFYLNGEEIVSDKEYKVTVSKPDPSALRELQIGQNDNISSPEEVFAWYKFTPKEAGIYDFSPNRVLEVFYEDGDMMSQAEGNIVDGFSLSADTTYYVGFQGKLYDPLLWKYTNIFTLFVKNTCNWEIVENTKPTCTTDGKIVKKCTEHEDTVETVIPATGHEITGEWTVTKPATCTEDGEKTAVCSKCEENVKEKIPATNIHDYKWVTDKEATCVEAGSRHQECKVCKAVGETEVIQAPGHAWGKWTTTKQATCTENGEQIRKCTRDGCNAEDTGIIKTPGHSWGTQQTVESTNETNGKIYQICEVCGEENIIKILPLAATADVVEKTQEILSEIENTENEAEKAEKINNAVNEITKADNKNLAKDASAMDAIDQLEEKVVANTSVAATVVENDNTAGITVDQNVKGAALTAAVNKDKADEEVKEIAAKISVNDVSAENQSSYKEKYGNNMLAVDITMSVVDAANTDNAISKETEDVQPAAPVQMKLILPEQYADQEIELLHNHNGEIETLAFTREGAVLTFTITSLSDVIVHAICKKHQFGEWMISKTPTCTKEGEKTKVCEACREIITEKIRATGKHSMGAWKVTKAATAVATGVKERTCKVCGGAKERASIAKLKATLTLNVPINRTLPMKMRQTFQAKASGLAKGDKVVSWTSSNRRVATVSGNGRIAAQRIAGNAVITVKLASGKTAKFTVKVQRTDVATTAITVTNKATRRRLTGTVNLKLRKNLALGVGLTPLTSTQRVTYSTSNSRIATVNSRGVVTARRAGTVTITVKSGRKIARIRVKVTK